MTHLHTLTMPAALEPGTSLDLPVTVTVGRKAGKFRVSARLRTSAGDVVFSVTASVTTDPNGPGYGDPGQPHYTDCSSEDCSWLSCPMYGGSSCTGFCNGCDSQANSCNLLKNPAEVPVGQASPCYYVCGCGVP